MKCSFCGNEIENGAELCPSCGMILSLGDDNDNTGEEIKIPEFTPNIFGAEKLSEEKTYPAQELPANNAEEEVPVVTSIPEYVPDNYVFEDISSVSAEAAAEQEEAPAQEVAEDTEEEIAKEITEEAAEEVAEEQTNEEVGAVADVLGIRVPDEELTYPEYESFVSGEEEYESVETHEEPAESAEEQQDEEFEEVSDDDTYVKPNKLKSGVGAIIALCLLLVCLVFAGGYVLKNVMPEKQTTTTSSTVDVDATTDEDEENTTEEDTTEAEEDTTEAEEDTTEAEETTTGATTQEVTTTEATTAEKTENTTTAVSTTKQTTTAVTTTKAVTTAATTEAATTKATATTEAATTKAPSTTTDPYGINDVTVKKPSSKFAESFKGYVTVSSIKVRSNPSDSAERVLYLEKGSEVVVSAEENGFYYVYSTRFGVSGWAKAQYISKSRPTVDTTSVQSGTVEADKSADGKTMYTTYTLNLRKGPSTEYGVLKTIPIGYPVKVLGYKTGVSGWAYVTDLTTGVNGWVSTAYLK